MVVDEKASSFFHAQSKDAANSVCCDCGTDGASWASISHGIYLSIGAAGVHRSLGVKVSFVQSTTMDSWQPLHLKMMELGGNRRFNEYLRAQGVPEDMPIRLKYSTRAAQWYREDLRAEAEGSERPEPLPAGTGHLPFQSSSNQRILDKVYAKTPCSSASSNICQSRQSCKSARNGAQLSISVTNDASAGKEADVSGDRQVERQRPSTGNSRSNSLGSSSSHGRRHSIKRRKSFSSQLPNSFSLWLPMNPLPILLGASKCPTAERLQTMSSGRMEGFGSDNVKCTPTMQVKINSFAASAA
jgi:ADP-ribosylation factor GTPase-activating protein 1